LKKVMQRLPITAQMIHIKEKFLREKRGLK